MKAFIGLLIFLGVAGSGAALWYFQGGRHTTGTYRTVVVERGNLTAVVSSTGPTQAENVIDIGAQNSIPCQIRTFGPDLLRNSSKPVDRRSPVDKDQVLAQLDDRLYKTQLDQAEAEVDQAKINVLRAEADLLQMQSRLTQADRDWQRMRGLVSSKGVVSELDYDIARTNYEAARSTLTVGKAVKDAAVKGQVKAEAALAQARTNLEYCTIKSPIKGMIIDRRVNVGQTVVSGLTASSLFLIAEDLKKLEVWAAVNEADIGVVKKGQRVLFTVDAYPGETFLGFVKEVGLNANNTQNVVTFPVYITVDNSDERLYPYMTANVRIEVAQRDNVILVPSAALRWKPLMTQVLPEERVGYGKSLQPKEAGPIKLSKPGEIDKDKERGTRGTVWVRAGEHVRPVKLRLGLTDGTNTEVLGDGLNEGDEVVIGATQVSSGEDAVINPFAPKIERKKNDGSK